MLAHVALHAVCLGHLLVDRMCEKKGELYGEVEEGLEKLD